MSKKPTISIRSTTPLSGVEIRVLIEKGNTLFSLMRLTEEAKAFLKYNQDLAEVIEKW
jgi:hypothetical protein